MAQERSISGNSVQRFVGRSSSTDDLEGHPTLRPIHVLRATEPCQKSYGSMAVDESQLVIR